MIDNAMMMIIILSSLSSTLTKIEEIGKNFQFLPVPVEQTKQSFDMSYKSHLNMMIVAVTME